MGISWYSRRTQITVRSPLALFDQVRRDHPEIAVVGWSLGSAVAVRLAAERPVHRLVLVAPFDSAVDVGAAYLPFLPLRWLITDKFESWRLAPAVRAPTLVMQAERDEVIPAARTARLFAAFGKDIASLVVIRGAGHSGIHVTPEYLDAMRIFLSKNFTHRNVNVSK